MIGKKGDDLVSIPLPQLDVPHFRYGHKGSRRRRPGRRRSRAADRPRRRRATAPATPASDPGRPHPRSRAHARRAGRRSSARSWSCRASSPRARRTSSRRRTSTPASARPAPSRCATSSAPTSEALKRQIASSTYDPDDPCVVPDPRGQAVPLLERRSPSRSQRGHHLHDGRLRLDDRRAEGDRPHRGVLDRHLAQEPVRRRRDRATSSTTPSPRKSTSTRSTTPARAAARGSARPTSLRRQDHRRRVTRRPTGTSTASTSPTATTGAKTTASASSLLRDTLLPSEPVRLRPGRKPLRQRRVLPRARGGASATSTNAGPVGDRRQGRRSYESIKEFLGKGR